jgi:hypothetical protein
MSAEMLESVSRYVSRLRRRARSSRRVSSVQDKREAAMLFVKNLSVQGGMPVPADESVNLSRMDVGMPQQRR